jgi:hypothetical protein
VSGFEKAILNYGGSHVTRGFRDPRLQREKQVFAESDVQI